MPKRLDLRDVVDLLVCPGGPEYVMVFTKESHSTPDGVIPAGVAFAATTNGNGTWNDLYGQVIYEEIVSVSAVVHNNNQSEATLP